MVMIAGMNGAGKSTCYRVYLAEALTGELDEHIDPDVIEKALRADCINFPPNAKSWSALAQEESNQRRINCLKDGVSFSFETVFSDNVGDKLRFMKEARDRGYFVVLLGVGLCSAEKSEERVALRVTRGGHSVPVKAILERYPRVLKNLDEGVKIASLALLVDNSEDVLDHDGAAYKAFAIFEDGVLVEQTTFPAWWPVTHDHSSEKTEYDD